MMYEIFRILGIIAAYPIQLVFFKRRTFCENGNKKLRRIKGGALIISNHFNVVDYIMNLFVVMPRKLTVVAAELAFKHAFVRFSMRFFGAIEANRVSKNLSFIDEGAAVINKGRLLQIFPEGHNTPDGSIQEFSTSYIMIAHRANSPIIPIVGDGNYGLFRRASVIIGEPIYLMDYCPDGNMTGEKISQINDAIHKKMCKLKNELEENKRAKRR